MHEVASLLVELGAVVLGLGLVARLASRLSISPIPLFLIAGLILGEGGILPVVTSEEFIEVGAEIGVIFLLLMLGLEYSANELVDGMKSVALSGIVDLFANFTPGFIAGLLLGWDLAPAVFLGGVTYISSSGVIAKLFGDMGWTGNRETPIVLSLLVFEDLVMALLLPILGVMALGGTAIGAVLAAVVALTAVVVSIAFAYRQGDRMGSFIFHTSDEVSLLTIFGLTLLVAGIAERIGVSAAVGAFLVGISVSGPSAERARVLLAPLRDLFAAVFFVFFGLKTDPGKIPDVLLVAVALGFVTAATKFWVGKWSARRAGIGAQGQTRAGLLIMPRGEFSIIIAGLGATVAGGQQLPALAAAYVLLMAIAGPIAVRVYASKASRQAASATKDPATDPSAA